MRRVVRLMIAVAAILLIVGAAAIWWLFYDNRLPRDGRYPLDLTAIRAAAARLPGPGPARIEMETLSHTYVPRIAMVAGAGWSKMDLIRASYRLVWPDRSIVVDTGYAEARAKRFGAASYDHAAWTRMQRALDRASAIVVTHEHADHIGGLIESPHLAAILPRALLNPEQAAGPRSEPLLWPRALLAGYRPLAYAGLRAIAPGVVLIRAPGHTPGSQMIYVRRADGRELLFMGDVASSAANVETGHIRSRYVTTYFGAFPDDRRAVMLQTMALRRLAHDHPEVALVPGHDAVAIDALVRRGLMTRGFAP